MIAAILLLASAALTTACGGDAKDDTPTDGAKNENGIKAGGTAVVGQGAEPITLNPDGKPDDNMPQIAQNVFQRLVKTNNNQAVILDLATGYTISEDGTEYTFTLPDNVTFHDGEPLTSDDVKFTFDEILKQNGWVASSFSGIQEITCPDDTTVVFKMKEVDVTFVGNLAYNGTYILPRHVYEGKDWLDADALMEPVGSGPFKFSKWDKGVSLTLERYDNFYRGEELPYLDKLVYSFITDGNTAMQAFYNGEMDMLGSIIPPSSEYSKLLSDPDIECPRIVYPSRFYVGFNLENSICSDINFRRAVAHAIDSDDIIAKAIKESGLKATTWVSPVFDWALNTDPEAAVPAHDLEKAKEYMTQTGLEADKDGVYAKFTVDTYNYEPFPEFATVLKEELAKIGVAIDINMMEYGAWEEKVNSGDFTMVIGGGYQGPDISALRDRITTGKLLNHFNYSNADVDRLMAEGEKTPVYEERAPKYQEVQKILAQDLPFVVVSEWLGYMPYRAYVKGHPASEEAVEKTAFGEFTYVWLDK
ncbi:MAG: ABC transporter substrate-binding protein [Clostridiales Family XIII bacterium]|nr:ABC transporter substrate-binding protein [Clostridiales Family XIII bacterium]